LKHWQITWENKTWSNDHVVVAHALAVSGLVDGAATGVEVSPWDGPQQLFAWLAVLVASGQLADGNTDDMSQLVAAAMDQISRAPLTMFVAALTEPLPAPTGEPVSLDPEG